MLENEKTIKVEKGWICGLEITCDFESQGNKFNIVQQMRRNIYRFLNRKMSKFFKGFDKVGECFRNLDSGSGLDL